MGPGDDGGSSSWCYLQDGAACEDSSKLPSAVYEGVEYLVGCDLLVSFSTGLHIAPSSSYFVNILGVIDTEVHRQHCD